MNVFLLDQDPLVSASYLVDDHVAFVTTLPGRAPIRSCKMAIEALQLLSAAHWYRADRVLLESADRSVWPAPYRPSHQNHPWTIAVRSSRDAYRLVLEHAQAMLLEHEYRTGKEISSVQAALNLLVEPPGWLGENSWMVPVCRPGESVRYVESPEKAVELYRLAYLGKIEKMPRFTRRIAPDWSRT